MSPSSPGFTSSPSVRNSAIWLTHARPSWKSMIVRRLGIVALPSISAVTYTDMNPEPCATSATPYARAAVAMDATG
jgi:hypothetical protein